MNQLSRVLIVSLLLSATGAAAGGDPPSFIFVLSEDIAHGDLGATGRR